MRVLMVHNAYQQYGGEDSVFAAEVELLRGAGIHVDTLEECNDSITGAVAQARTALFATYNPEGRRKMAAAIARTRPDIVHVHNFFPRLSPAIFDACDEAGVPAVWTMHNYRITCANGLLFRDGGPCEDCVGRPPWPGVVHRCYRGSLAGSAAVAAMIGYHRAAGTWRRKVARFIALSEFARNTLARAGVPADRLVVKPNFVADPLGGRDINGPRAGFVYVGRLSIEKGVRTLIDAWRSIDAPLTIIGDGPEAEDLRSAAPSTVLFLGHRNRTEVFELLSASAAIIVPSIWYENCPMTVIEGMAMGTPVITSRIGALAELVENGVSGFHFEPGNADDLARTVKSALAGVPGVRELSAGARLRYEKYFEPNRNLERLKSIYTDAVRDHPSGMAA